MFRLRIESKDSGDLVVGRIGYFVEDAGVAEVFDMIAALQLRASR